MYLSEVVSSRDNNFALLRLLAAWTVIVDHSFDLVHDYGPWTDRMGVPPGTVAVYVFFVISGFLVTRSLAYRRDATEYVMARALRIFPALVVHLVVIALLVAPFITPLPMKEYFSDTRILGYIWDNTQMLVHPYPNKALPGLTLPNPSLWTLPVETSCYVMLVCGWVVWGSWRRNTLRSRAVLALAMIAGGVAAYRYTRDAGGVLLCMFGSGALAYAFRDRIRLTAIGCAIACIVIGLGAWHGAMFGPALLVALPYVVFCAAYLPGGRIRAFNRLGDYSYGTYIYGFPVQFVIHLWMPSIGVWELTLVSSLVVLIPAALSWHLIEEPVLRSVPRAALGLRAMVGPRAYPAY